MSTAPRIDELRKKFEENPRRYFAPLANELRKTGDVANAILLCREHLPKQPGHMSGYIVFGQALFDAGELDESRAVFEQALALDPENLIALRQLGDIARRDGDLSLARRWYERVLDADPRNDEIATQLAALVTPLSVTPLSVTPLSAPPVAAVTQEAPTHATVTPVFTAREVEPTPLSVVATPADVVEALPPLSDLEPSALVLDDPFVFGEAAEPAANVESAQADADAVEEVAEEPFEEGLVAPTWPDTSDLALRALTPRSVTPLSVPVPPDIAAAFGQLPDERPATALPDPEPDLPIDFDLVASLPEPPAAAIDDGVDNAVGEHVDDVDETTIDDDAPDELPWIAEPVRAPSAEVEAIVEAIAEDARALGESDDVHVFAMPESRYTPVNPPVIESFADVMDDDGEEAAVAPQALVTDANDSAFVTETMGELLLAQGFTDRAITVFEELVRRQPDNTTLAQRLDALRAAQESESAARVLPTPSYAGTPVYGATPVQSLTPVQAFTPVQSLTPAQVFTPAQAFTPAYSQTPMHVDVAAVSADVAYPPMLQRTARAQFAALAARRVGRRAPTPVTTLVTTSADAYAAAVTPASPTPRSAFRMPTPSESLAALFGTDGLAGDDDARDFASAFSNDATPNDGRGLFSGGFAAVPTPSAAPAVATPRASTPAIASPVVNPTTPPSATDPFSFDRFFPDPALATPGSTPGTPPAPSRPAQATPGAASTAPSGDAKAVDDLAQFTAWLKGLGAP